MSVHYREAVGRRPVEELLAESFGGMSVGREGAAGSRVSLESVDVDPLRLDRVSVGPHLVVAVDPVEQLSVNVVRQGRLGCSTGGQDRRYLAGDVCLASQPEEPLRVDHRDTVVDAVRLPLPLVQDVAGVGPGESPVRLLGYEPATREAGWRWAATMSTMRSEVLLADQTHPLVTAAAARLLVATALTVFPNTAVLTPTAADRRDAHPQTLRVALDFLEAHADRDVSVGDVARAAHVSVRAVQLAFRRHLDTTPLAHLRAIRLRRAHEDLIAADPGRATVAIVAGRWGFVNASRFAARYRQVYGQPPSRTLRG